MVDNYLLKSVIIKKDMLFNVRDPELRLGGTIAYWEFGAPGRALIGFVYYLSQVEFRRIWRFRLGIICFGQQALFGALIYLYVILLFDSGRKRRLGLWL